MSPSEAPTALQMPISWWRSRTVIRSVLMMPRAATTKATVPTAPKRTCRKMRNIRISLKRLSMVLV